MCEVLYSRAKRFLVGQFGVRMSHDDTHFEALPFQADSSILATEPVPGTPVVQNSEVVLEEGRGRFLRSRKCSDAPEGEHRQEPVCLKVEETVDESEHVQRQNSTDQKKQKLVSDSETAQREDLNIQTVQKMGDSESSRRQVLMTQKMGKVSECLREDAAATHRDSRDTRRL